MLSRADSQSSPSKNVHHISWAQPLHQSLTEHWSNHTARRAGFDLTKESYYPSIIGNASQGGGATSWFHLQYLQLNKHFVSSSVLHACEFQITQRLKRTLNINWHKAERMEVRSERSLWDWDCFTFALLPNDTGCEAWISTEIRRGIQSGSCGLVGISVHCWLTQKWVEHRPCA